MTTAAVVLSVSVRGCYDALRNYLNTCGRRFVRCALQNTKFRKSLTLLLSESETPISHREPTHRAKSNVKDERARVNQTKLRDVVNDFNLEIPFSGLNRKERIILARLKIEHIKISHKHFMKNIQMTLATDAKNFSQINTFYMNQHILYLSSEKDSIRLIPPQS